MVSHVRLENKQNYRQQVCLSCMTGLYGCRWKRYRRSTEPTTVVEKTFLLIAIIAFAFMSIWLYYWIIAENSADDLNWYLWDVTKKWFHWFTLMFTLTIIAFIYTTFLVLLAIAHCITGQQLHLYIVHKVTIILILCACVAFGITLTELWPQEWDLMFISLQVTAPILQIMGVVILTFLTWPLAGIWWKSTSSTAFRWVTFIAYSCLLLFVYLCPLFFLTPCMLGHNSLPKRPLIMAHKGTEMLTPENTDMSFRKAASYNIYGFESDVRISLDGIPFVMHDSTLERTTNVHKVYPNRTTDRSESFTFEELQRLNAGSWFLNKDPFRMAKRLSNAEKEQLKNQTIPSLTQLLKIAKQYNKSVMFDLFAPPNDHPYRGNYVETTVAVINASGIRPNQIWWLSNIKREWVLEHAPGFEQTEAAENHRPQEYLTQFHIVHMNAEYSNVNDQDIQDFKKINISTNIYTVNKPWLYSLYWCVGVKSVTSSACQVLHNVEAPIWHTTPQIWRIIWILEDCVSLVCVVLIFVFQRYRFPRRPSNPEAISLHSNRSFAHPHGKKSDRELLYRSNEDTPMPAPDDQSINHRPHNGYEDIPSPDGTSSPTESLPTPQHEEVRMTLE